MTIKAFAALCGCTPQTLRYYDQVNLLKPVKVDPYSGYRYYEKAQAYTFVKIKNLQKAGFSIEEIRNLLQQDDQAVYDAFEAKIAEAEEKLREMKKIQRSYQTDMHTLQERLKEAAQEILSAAENYDPTPEFGITKAQYTPILEQIRQCMEHMNGLELPENCDPEYDIHFPEEKEPDIAAFLQDPAYTLLYEKHGWARVKDFLAQWSTLKESGEYKLCFQVTKEKREHSTAFMNTMLGLMLEKNPHIEKTFMCNMETSTDGQNHFWLLKRK